MLIKPLWVLFYSPKMFHRDGFSPKKTLHGFRQRFFVKPYWVYWKVKWKILFIDRNIDFLIINKCSTVLNLYKFYIKHTQMWTNLYWYFRYVLCIIYLYKNLNQWKGYLISAKYCGLYYCRFYFVEFLAVD